MKARRPASCYLPCYHALWLTDGKPSRQYAFPTAYLPACMPDPSLNAIKCESIFVRKCQDQPVHSSNITVPFLIYIT